MPIYEFRCEGCGERFETLVAIGTEGADCPSCGTPNASRVLSQVGAVPKFVKTARTNRRLEDKRGTNRDGARTRFKESLRRGRQKRGGGGS
jgi:putative FmdB family regulatory protein